MPAGYALPLSAVDLCLLMVVVSNFLIPTNEECTKLCSQKNEFRTLAIVVRKMNPCKIDRVQSIQNWILLLAGIYSDFSGPKKVTDKFSSDRLCVRFSYEEKEQAAVGLLCAFCR